MPRAATRPNFMHSAAAPVPVDVRLMNQVAGTVYAVAAVGALVAVVLWLMRSPLFPIRGIQLEGEVVRNTVSTIRANAAPQLAGNFFSVDLRSARSAFETVPWVRRAVVRRVWPDHLAVRLEEHQAAALWEGSGYANEPQDTDKLVNSYGEVFQANVDDVEEDGLPLLTGPEGSAAQMLALHRRLRPLFASLAMGIDKLSLSGRGSWRVELDSGATVEVGRGTEEEVVARTERFVRTLHLASAQYPQPLEYADLRHADGYALRLRGVSTTPNDAAVGKPKPVPAAQKDKQADKQVMQR
jgi:cell division protein FtsQ